MRNITFTLIGFTIILMTISIICSLTTLSVKDDELFEAINYAAEMTIDSLDNEYINGTDIVPNEAYSKLYHYKEAISEALKECKDTHIIADSKYNELTEYVSDNNVLSIAQILNSDIFKDVKENFEIQVSNMVLEKVFIHILMDSKDSNATYSVKFYNVDVVNGIMDVEVTQVSMYNKSYKCETTKRCTVIKEDYKK